jgi:hypothetical protein
MSAHPTENLTALATAEYSVSSNCSNRVSANNKCSKHIPSRDLSMSTNDPDDGSSLVPSTKRQRTTKWESEATLNVIDSKRKSNPYKTTGLDDNHKDGDDYNSNSLSKTSPSSIRRKRKAKARSKTQQDDFESLPGLSMVVSFEQPFSNELEREILEEDDRFEKTGYDPPQSHVYPSDIADPFPGVYMGATMPFFEESPLPIRKERKHQHRDEAFQDSQKLKFNPAWKCENCGTTNPEDESSCLSCAQYKKVDLDSKGWGNLFADQMNKWKCETCQSRVEQSEKQCNSCGTWLCPSCAKQSTIDQEKCQHCRSERPSYIQVAATGTESTSESHIGSIRASAGATDSGAIGSSEFSFGTQNGSIGPSGFTFGGQC